MIKKLLPTIAAIAMLAPAAEALACAVCLSGADDAITHGYNASVLFLMATPYAVGGCIAAGVIFAYRRASRRRGQADEDSANQMSWKQEESSR
jgi:hypothetical protein